MSAEAEGRNARASCSASSARPVNNENPLLEASNVLVRTTPSSFAAPASAAMSPCASSSGRGNGSTLVSWRADFTSVMASHLHAYVIGTKRSRVVAGPGPSAQPGGDERR